MTNGAVNVRWGAIWRRGVEGRAIQMEAAAVADLRRDCRGDADGGRVHTGLAGCSAAAGARQRVRRVVRAFDAARCGATGVHADFDAQPAAAVCRTTQRPDGLAVQGEDGTWRDGRLAAAHRVPLLFQLCAGESHAEFMV